MKFLTPCKRLITYLEDPTIPLGNFVIAFLCLITLRNFFENFSHSFFVSFIDHSELFVLWELLHFNLAYILLAVLLVLVIYAVTRINLIVLARVVLFSFFLTVFVPLVDTIISAGAGHHIYYLFPNLGHSISYYFLHFFGDYQGASFGMRSEIVVAMLFALLYVQIKKSNWLLSLLSAFLVYCAIFFMLASPYLVCFFAQLFAYSCLATTQEITCYYLIVLASLGSVLAYCASPTIFMAIIKDFRWLRLFHYELMVVLGMLLTGHKFTAAIIPQALLIFIAVAGFFQFSVITNNIADQAIDAVSNPLRPLITHTINLSTYRKIAWFFLLLTLIYAAATGVVALSFIAVTTLLYLLYSMPPVRLKRIPIFSKVIIAGISLILVLLGYYLLAGNWHGFPLSLIWFFLIGVTLVVNFIDLKDYTGDKSEHILTLPVLLGDACAKKLIGVFFILTSLSFYFYLQNIVLVPLLLLLGGLEYYFLTRKEYKEYKIFWVYLLSLALLLISLWIKNTF